MLNEGQHIEFKPAFNEDVIETLVAFANTKGGMFTWLQRYSENKIGYSYSIKDLLSNNYQSMPCNDGMRQIEMHPFAVNHWEGINKSCPFCPFNCFGRDA